MIRSRITTLLLVVVTAWIGVAAVGVWLRSRSIHAELEALNKRNIDTQRENARLSGQIQRLQSPEWLALLARQRLNYKLPGENVVFVYKSEKSGTIVQPQSTPDARPVWRKWLDWLKAGVVQW